MSSELKVICVLRSGGSYDAKYVKALEKSVSAQLQRDFEFICLTDTPVEDINCIDLLNNWISWWSKIELFRLKGPCLYFDLDTVIVGNLAQLYDTIIQTTEKKIWMLRPFGKHEVMASGIMAWTGDWGELYASFSYGKDIRRFRGDQDYLTSMLKDKINCGFIQDHIEGVYSYKYHCKDRLPNDAKIICFHGKPRPHEMSHLDWMQKHWRIK